MRDAFTKKMGFTLLEMVAVVVIMAVLLGAVAVALGNSRPSVQVKKDGAQMIAFLRNMWDQTKSSGTPLVLLPDYEKGSLRYRDPRLGREKVATFDSGAKLIAIIINDRAYSADSRFESSAGDPSLANAIYISEGRGLTRVGVVFAVPIDDQTYDFLTYVSLNLINGKGQATSLEESELQDLLSRIPAGASS